MDAVTMVASAGGYRIVPLCAFIERYKKQLRVQNIQRCGDEKVKGNSRGALAMA